MSDQASTIMVNTLEPQSGTTLTVGKSGQNLQVNADSLKANVAKDAGGNAVFTSDGSGNLSGLNSAFGSAEVLITTTTVSTAVSEIEFTSGITSTYKEYVFKLHNIAPETETGLRFAVSTDGGSSYGIDKTTTAWHQYNNAAADHWGPGYDAGRDLPPNGTNPAPISGNLGNSADQAYIGEIHLFNPAGTTYVKNYYMEMQMYNNNNYAWHGFFAGYVNSTGDIDAIKFTMASGNITAGTIKMYGIK